MLVGWHAQQWRRHVPIRSCTMHAPPQPTSPPCRPWNLSVAAPSRAASLLGHPIDVLLGRVLSPVITFMQTGFHGPSGVCRRLGLLSLPALAK